MFKLFEKFEPKSSKKSCFIKEVKIDELTEDMFLANEILTASGVIIGNKSQKINLSLIVTQNKYK
jgi:hypothetical protein